MEATFDLISRVRLMISREEVMILYGINLVKMFLFCGQRWHAYSRRLLPLRDSIIPLVKFIVDWALDG